ncbi:MAG: diguanylate cyclase, partial [Proteobacteria bacterium]
MTYEEEDSNLNARLRTAIAERDALRDELDQLRRKQPLVEALDNIIEAIVIYDADGRLVVCNENFRALYGYTLEETRAGVHFSKLGRIDVERGNVAVGDEFGSGDAYLARKAEYRRKLEGSFIVQLKDGRWIKTIDRRLSDGGFVSIQIDVTEVKTLEQDMRYMAQHDPLTGLPNRRLFMEKGGTLLASAARNGGCFAILFVDIDGYKQVNDSLGHQVGDRILELVADRLERRMRSSDVVARFGGDEFVVLLGGAHPAAARHVADVIIGEIKKPFIVERREVKLGASIGIAYFPDDGRNLDDLLRLADTALYR